MKRIVIFASGSGTNAEAIVNYFAQNKDVAVVAVLSNRSNAQVHTRMAKLGIPTETFSREEWADGEIIITRLRNLGADFVVLAGFLCYIAMPILKAYDQRIVNIHPSLLPRHGGRGMWGKHVHQAVLESGEAESGITIHRVTADVDGGEILFQAKCPVLVCDTVELLAERVHKLEYEHYPRIIEQLL